MASYEATVNHDAGTNNLHHMLANFHKNRIYQLCSTYFHKLKVDAGDSHFMEG